MLVSNIILIGMPGSGKSTVGKHIASTFDKEFIDADDLIEQAANMPIQAIVDEWGLARFSELEESVLCDLDCQNAVVSTGGSAVFSDRAMSHLGNIGCRLFLQISLETLLARVTNESSRGLYKKPSQSLTDLYNERLELYPRYADLTFDNDGSFEEADRSALSRLLNNFKKS